MAINPSVENYTLGRGRLYFAPYDTDGTTLLGERALGNAPAFTFNMAIEKLEHYSSMTGLKAKDKTVVTQVTPSLNFTLDELSEENMNMLFFGSTTAGTQTADDFNLTVLPAVELDRYYDLGAMDVGIYKFTLSATPVGDWAVGDTITGGTSLETAVLREIIGSTFYISTISGPFTAGEAITNAGTGTNDLLATTAEMWDATHIVVWDGVSTFYTKGTDFMFDTASGRVLIKSTGTILAGATDVNVVFGFPDKTYTTLNAMSVTSIEGQLRFTSDYPEGPNMTLTAWIVNLTPDGDTSFIGDDWSTMAFTGEVLADEAGHPDSPYLAIVM